MLVIVWLNIIVLLWRFLLISRKIELLYFSIEDILSERRRLLTSPSGCECHTTFALQMKLILTAFDDSDIDSVRTSDVVLTVVFCAVGHRNVVLPQFTYFCSVRLFGDCVEAVLLHWSVTGFVYTSSRPFEVVCLGGWLDGWTPVKIFTFLADEMKSESLCHEHLLLHWLYYPRFEREEKLLEWKWHKEFDQQD